MRSAPLLLVVAGCSQLFGLDTPERRRGDAGEDAAPDIDAMVDVRIPVGTCKEKWVQGPVFGTAQPVMAVNTGGYESDPFVSDNGLRLFYQHSFDVYTATRNSTTVPFGSGTVVTTLSSQQTETKVFLSPSGQRVFFASSRTGGLGGMDLWRGTNSTQTFDNWTVDEAYVVTLNTAGDEHDPFMSPDLLHIYFAPVGAGGVQRIAFSSRGSTSQDFGVISTFPELDLAGNEADPTLTDDERVIVFTAMISNKRRLQYATRATASGPFGAPIDLAQLNANMNEGDSDPHVTPDGCTLYWTSFRDGSGDIYVATQL